MCRAMESLVQEEVETERLNNIRTLMETLELSADRAMAALRIPKEEWRYYQKLLERQS